MKLHNDTEKTAADQLTPAQIQVLQFLLGGETVSAAAKAGAVSRETVHRWLREDFAFQASYNRGRRELFEEIQDRLLIAARRAANTIAEAIEGGDVKAALALLKGLGGLSGEDSGRWSNGSVGARPGGRDRAAGAEVRFAIAICPGDVLNESEHYLDLDVCS